MFDDAVRRSIRTIANDIFPRFKKSDEFQELSGHMERKAVLPAIEMDIVTLLDNPEIHVETKTEYTSTCN